MSENNYVNVDDYKFMCIFIKDSMDDFFETLNDFDNGTYYDIF